MLTVCPSVDILSTIYLKGLWLSDCIRCSGDNSAGETRFGRYSSEGKLGGFAKGRFTVKMHVWYGKGNHIFLLTPRWKRVCTTRKKK